MLRIKNELALQREKLTEQKHAITKELKQGRVELAKQAKDAQSKSRDHFLKINNEGSKEQQNKIVQLKAVIEFYRANAIKEHSAKMTDEPFYNQRYT